MFKMILSVISGLEGELLEGDFEKVNSIMSSFNSGKSKVTADKKDTFLPNIEELVFNAKKMSVTLPDFTATASHQSERI